MHLNRAVEPSDQHFQWEMYTSLYERGVFIFGVYF